MLIRLADLCYRRRRLVVVAWLAALIGAFALASAFGGELKQDYLQPGSESKAAADVLSTSFPQRAGDTMQVVVHSDVGFAAPDVQARAEAIFAAVANEDHVVAVVSPFSPEARQPGLQRRDDRVRRGRARHDSLRLHRPGSHGPGRTGPGQRR